MSIIAPQAYFQRNKIKTVKKGLKDVSYYWCQKSWPNQITAGELLNVLLVSDQGPQLKTPIDMALAGPYRYQEAGLKKSNAPIMVQDCP